MTFRTAGGRLAAALAAAGLAYLAFPPADIGPLAWFALVPLLAALRGLSPGRAALLGWAWGALFLGLLCAWLAVFSSAAPVAIAAGSGLFYAAAAAVYAARPGPLAAAAAWTTAEWLRGLGPLGFTWGDLGYALWRAPFLLQAADLGGVYLLTFAVAWTNGAVAEWVTKRRPHLLAAATAAPLLLLAYGGLPRRGGAAAPWRGEAAIIQPDLRKGSDWAADADRAWAVLGEATRAAGGGRTRLVVWPETVVRRYLDREPALRAEIGALAAEIGAPILVGAPGTDAADRKYNSVFLVDADGAIAGRYDKVHLVPAGEYVPLAALLGRTVEHLSPEAPGDFTAAAAPALVDLTGTGLRLGPLICFEASFGRLARARVRSGADILVAVTNDGWSFSRAAHVQHLATNILRAVETRRWLLRCANTGISAAVSPDGRIVDSAPVYAAGLVRAPLSPPAATTTLYVRLGDWPGAAAAVLLGLTLGSRRRPPTGRRREDGRGGNRRGPTRPSDGGLGGDGGDEEVEAAPPPGGHLAGAALDRYLVGGMGIEILTAAVAINLILLIGYALLVRARPDLLLGRSWRRPVPGDARAAEREVADLLVELNRVARSHVDAVEARRAALLETLDMANDRIRRLHALSADLDVISKRIRLDGARPAGTPPAAPVEHAGTRTERPREDRLSLGLRDKASIE